MSNTIKLSAANSPTVKLGDSDMIRVDKQIKNLNDSVAELENSKVDKADGKGLSSNDFTNADKNKLDSLENYDDTDLQETVAELDSVKEDKSNKITEFTENCTDEQYPSAKAVKDALNALDRYVFDTYILGFVNDELELCEKLSNKVTCIDDSQSDDEQKEEYPNVKAVLDYFQKKTTFKNYSDDNDFDILIHQNSNGVEYVLGEKAVLTAFNPSNSTFPNGFIMSVAFSSGETPTVFKVITGNDPSIVPQIEGNIYMQGTDCSDGVFTPTANKRYTVIFSYDGEILSGIVNGIPKAVSE